MIDNLNELVQWREVGKEVRVRHFVLHTFAAFESNETTILSGVWASPDAHVFLPI